MNFEEPKRIRNEQIKEAKDPNLKLREHFQGHLNLNKEEAAAIKVLEMKRLPEAYFHQFDLLDDARLNSVRVAIIPDKLWQKGSQVSESSAENSLITINESYFTKEKPDEFGWFTHELGHCQKFFDEPKEYDKKSEEPAFPEIQSGYPNNQVELHAFTKQFEFLKGKGTAKNEVWQYLQQEYPQWAREFLQKVLDKVYQ